MNIASVSTPPVNFPPGFSGRGSSRPDIGGGAPGEADRNHAPTANPASDTPGASPELTPSEQREVAELKKRDAAVKAHERAHIAAGGPYVSGGASFEYEQGPDGRNYAVGGEVTIDVSPVEGNPEATMRKMQVVRRAAIAPADPSPQDRRVAAQASQIESQARMELSQKRMEESTSGGSGEFNTVHGIESYQQHAASPSGTAALVNVMA